MKIKISSRKNKLKKWLFNKHSALYLLILVVLSIFIFYAIANGFNSASADEEASTTSDDENATESSTSFIADNASYCIKVNKAKNFITVYKVNASGELQSAYKTFVCSVNKEVEDTTSQISEKYVWRKISDNVYGQYTSRIGVSTYIHSVPYRSESTKAVIANAYNNLGKNAEIGSIYLQVADAKWIYENCGMNTKVIIYSDENEEPAIALAEVPALADAEGIDLSDIANAEKVSPTQIAYLRGVKDYDITVGENIDFWDGIYAADVNHNEITSYIYLTGTFDSQTPGMYIVTYNLIDEYGTKIAYQSIIHVTENPASNHVEETQPANNVPTENTQNNNAGNSGGTGAGSSTDNPQNNQTSESNKSESTSATVESTSQPSPKAR